jgi:DNA-binding MarR family transcriptional regulator
MSNDTGQLLWQAANRWQAAQRAALKPHGLTPVQFALLSALAELTESGPVTQRALAGHVGADAMMTSQVVRTLEANGWVTREAHPADGRAWALRVTRAGSALARKAGAAAAASDAEFFEALGPRHSAFTRALRALREASF